VLFYVNYYERKTFIEKIPILIIRKSTSKVKTSFFLQISKVLKVIGIFVVLLFSYKINCT
jgi:hypothetical protein